MTADNDRHPLKVYWQPGCSSCLKTKEFLIANGVEFESINVIEDREAFEDLARLGVKMVPIVRRGKDWCNGAVFRDVARIAGFAWGGHEILAPAVLVERIDDLLAWSQEVQDRFDAWWKRNGRTTDFTQPGDVYYGDVNLHEVFERTAWHSGQHTRQIMLTLEEKLGLAPDGPLDEGVFAGLPMPSRVWDNETSFA